MFYFQKSIKTEVHCSWSQLFFMYFFLHVSISLPKEKKEDFWCFLFLNDSNIQDSCQK